MTITPYRDTACATENEWFYEIFVRATANGYSSSATGTSWSNGTTRVANAGPASAANLSATNAYFVIRFGAGGHFLTIKKTATGAALVEFTTSNATMAGGNATTPDRDATYTKIWLSSAQCYPTSGATATYAHTVVNDVTGSLVSLIRRSPNPGGSTDACAILVLDVVTPLTWVANPHPIVGGMKFSNTNVAAAVLLTAVWSAWLKFGIGGAAYNTTWTLENPGVVCGTTISPDGGADVDLELRWVDATTSNAVLGISTLFHGLQPYRNPVVGIDAGSTLSRAAFGNVSVLNDGTALAS